MNIPFIQQQFFNDLGQPLSGGKLYSFTAGSTTIPKPLYLNSVLSIAAPNPLVLNASGRPQKYYMEVGGYNLVLKDSVGNLVDSWDNQFGSVGGGDIVDNYTVKTSLSDTTPDFLISKLVPGAGMDVTEVVGATRQIEIASKGLAKVSMGDSAGYLDSKFTSSPSITFGTNGNVLSATVNVSNVLDYKVKTDSLDTTPAFLVDKFVSTPTISISSENSYVKLDVVSSALTGDHKVFAHFSDTTPGYLDEKIVTDSNLYKFVNDEDGVQTFEIGSLGKVGTVLGDIQGYLVDKIRGGSGVTITTTSDETNGTVLWVNSKTNLWTPIKYVNGSSYTVLDTDGTLVMGNDARSAVMFITLPTAGVNYLGRTVVIRGSSQWAGGVVLNTVVGSAGCGSNGSLAKGFEKNSFTCFYNNDTNSYVWFNDNWGIA